ncbi:hypothetical protein BGZ46_001036 [Entomortierella lignicola]|nr:hypothetical protein BGZ46_001036 [Entomortierella lignicola]
MSKEEHKERQRVTKACDNCRKKKIKCGQYLDPTKKRGPPKGAGRNNGSIEDRLHRMESIVGGMVEDEPNDSQVNENGVRPSGSESSTSGKSRRRKSNKANPKKPPAQGLELEMDQDDNQQVKSEHDYSSPLEEYALEHALEHQPFQAENSFHHQQQHNFLSQQQLSLQHPSQILNSRQDSSQSPDVASQSHFDDMRHVMDTKLINPLHSDLLRDNHFQSFNSPSPILSSDQSQNDHGEPSPGIDTLPQLGMNTPPLQDLDDLEDDMGHLTLDHKGHERYVGKSSPMFYNRRHWGGYSIRERELPNARKFVDNPDLPSPEVMTGLLNLYFAYVHPFAPVFVWSKFLKRLQTRDYSPSFLFLLNSVFAIASRFSDDLSLRTDPTKPETVGLRFVEKAKAILDTIYDTPDMYCVGGLVLLSYQQMGTGGGYRAWMFIGLSIRMAQHLGLNRDCMKLNPHMPNLDREERNRIWWTCFVADRLVSASFGRPQGINEHDVDATYPEGIDEENIQLEYRLDNANSMLTGPSPHSEKNFVYLASLTRILGRVMVSLYSPLSKASSKSNLSMTNPAPLEQLDKELTDWLLTLPPHLQFRSVQQEPGTFVCTLHMTFYATLILLHRPYSHQSLHNTHDWSISLSICTSAANNTIEMASNLMRSVDDLRDVPRLKCLLHSAVFIFFTAGIVHITNCTSLDPVLAASAKLRTVETLRCLSVIEDVWISGKWCGNNIKNLVKSRSIELPCSVEGFKYTIRNGADPASALNNNINPSQLDLLPSPYAIPKEQSFAFDVNQIMGYYQAPGSKHHEPQGRNSRHFSPTPYFSPVSPHHGQNQMRHHPGLIQGHTPLPRRPRQTKNTSPTPNGAVPLSKNNQAGPVYSGTTPSETVVATNPNFYSTPPPTTPLAIDPYAAPGSATVLVNHGDLQHTPVDSTPSPSAATGPLVYQNPFSSTLWSLPTSMDNDEWMLYMQNGGTSGQGGQAIPISERSNNTATTPSTTSSTTTNTTTTNTTNNNNSTNSNSGSKALSDHGSPTLLDNTSVNTNNLNSGNTANNRMHIHPLAQSLTRNDLLSGTGGGASNPTVNTHQNPILASNGGYTSQHPNSPTTPQQLHVHQHQRLQPTVSSNDYAFFLSSTNGAAPLQPTVVSNHSWNT